ncbi:MAG TPA: DUF4253 domain-containing protein [Polyangiaceae bacterium]|nr:DUF4253 domain-containing protein [Polyangiaceae bacterium]
MRHVLFVSFVALVASPTIGCRRDANGGSRAATSASVPASKPRSFPAVVAEAEKLFGSRATFELISELSPAKLPTLQVADGLAHVKANQARFLAMGAYLFVADHGFNLKKDSVALAATTDQFEVIRLAGSDAANFGHDNAQVIAWLRELDKAEPFVVTGAGTDYVEGYFTGPVRDPHTLADRIYSFCPDFVDQGIGLAEKGEPHELIVKHFRTTREFFFWWD